MARRRRKRKPLPTEAVEISIESLSHDGRGVAHLEGKTLFIDGALAGEVVKFIYTKQQRKHDEGQVVEVIKASPDRVEPRCAVFGLCGGCSLQHQAEAAQIKSKQQALLDALQRIGNVIPDQILPPLVSKSGWGYRQKARIGAKFVYKKDRLLVGFRERGTGFITDMTECHILVPKIGQMIEPLSTLIRALSIYDKTPQIEIAVDDQRYVLIFRVLETPTDEDIALFKAFEIEHQVSIYLQTGGTETVTPLTKAADLNYRLDDFNLTMHFLPTDFTQVNADINQQMLVKAVELLDLQAEDQVLDLFCGIGNFTLPLATKAGTVVGVEADEALVQRARDNATRNQINNTTFFTANLYGDLSGEPWLRQKFNKVLLDPPRSGAIEILPHLVKLEAKQILYVSCYPATLARDAGELVHKYGYKLVSAGVMDMFPHTAHVESMAYFTKK